MDVLYIVLAVLAGVIAIYLFMIFPSDGRKAKVFKGKFIAHRGLHGGETVENTLDAFKKAVDKGYGVELDIQLSLDKVPVVTHDYDLKRVFGIDKKVSSLSSEELGAIGVPTLSEVLNVLDGKVPLVAEIKGENADTEVCERAAVLLDGYKVKDVIFTIKSDPLLEQQQNELHSSNPGCLPFFSRNKSLCLNHLK